MVLNWKNGYKREVPAGAKLAGIFRTGSRPISVTLTMKDLQDIRMGPNPLGYLLSIETALTNNEGTQSEQR
jgi:hypothetical protein